MQGLVLSDLACSLASREGETPFRSPAHKSSAVTSSALQRARTKTPRSPRSPRTSASMKVPSTNGSGRPRLQLSSLVSTARDRDQYAVHDNCSTAVDALIKRYARSGGNLLNTNNNTAHPPCLLLFPPRGAATREWTRRRWNRARCVDVAR